MFKVSFFPEDWDAAWNECVVFTSQNDVEAIQFALSFHQASNVSHTIKVRKSHDPKITGIPEEDVCTLFKVLK